MLGGNAVKGDVLGAGRIAGIMAAKRTHQLIPLCHPLPITKVEVDIEPDHRLPGFVVRATVKVTGQTGVEMEALTAVSVACLTIYDMVKSVERGMRIEGIHAGREAGRQVGPLSCAGRQSRQGQGVAMALLSVADALARVLDGATPLPGENAPLDDAHGRVLSSDVVALRTQPPADVSAMDGYAVRAADVAAVPATLKLIGEVAAGHPFDGTVGPGAGRAHLHRRRGAARRRHDRDPGEHHARRR